MSGFAAPALVGLLAILPYLRILRYGFVSFDDPQMIEGNPLVRGAQAGGWAAAFSSFRMTSWQPLGWQLMAALDKLGGGSPAAFHAASLLLHGLNAALACALLRRALDMLPRPAGSPGSRTAAAALTALCWAWHPVQAESVAWAAPLSDLLCASFVLGALLLRERGRPRLGLLGFALASLCRWKALAYPAILLTSDLARATWRRKEKRGEYGALVILGAALVLVTRASKAGAGYSFSPRPHELAAGLLWQFSKVVFPLGLAPSRLLEGADNPLGLSSGAAWAILLVLAAAILIVARRRPATRWAFAGFCAMLLPPLLAVRPGAIPIYDHHLYLPLFVLAVPLSFGLARAKPWARGAAAAIALLLAAATTTQASRWRDSETLWGHVLDVYPRSQTARYNLALSRGSAGRVPEALAVLDDQLVLYPGDEAAVRFRAELLRSAAPGAEARARVFSDAAAYKFERGDAAGAAASLDEALALAPRDPKILLNAAIAAAARGDLGAARSFVARALKADPKNEAALAAAAKLGMRK